MNINVAKKSENPSYSGSKVYVGLDVHKKSWTVCIYLEDQEYKRFTQDPEVSILLKYLYRHFPEADYYCAYEAGFSGYWLYESLTCSGITCLVVHPADIPTTDKERRQKRDSIDARKIARELSNGSLVGINCPSKEEQGFRSLVRARLSLQRDITRYKNRIKMLLQFFGIDVSEQFKGRTWTQGFIRWLEVLSFEDANARLCLSLWVNQLKIQSSQLKALDKSLKEIVASGPWAKDMEYLLSVPGIGQVGGLILLSEIRDISRFKHLDQLAAYIGLIPNVNASGEKEYVGQMTRRGNSHLRYILIEASWRAIAVDEGLKLTYLKLKKRMKSQQAIVRIARKLLSRIRFVLKNKQQYQSNPTRNNE